MVGMNLTDLPKAMHYLSSYANLADYSHLLIDTGVPKSTCIEDWIQRANWSAVANIPLPESTQQFRFAGQQVKPL